MRSEFGLLFWLHLAIIVLVYLSPFIFKYQFIILFIVLYYIQIATFGNCILTRAQFNTGRPRKSFYSYYLNKMGIRVNDMKLTKFLDYVIPWLILSASLFWQVWLGKPIILG